MQAEVIPPTATSSAVCKEGHTRLREAAARIKHDTLTSPPASSNTLTVQFARISSLPCLCCISSKGIQGTLLEVGRTRMSREWWSTYPYPESQRDRISFPTTFERMLYFAPGSISFVVVAPGKGTMLSTVFVDSFCCCCAQQLTSLECVRPSPRTSETQRNLSTVWTRNGKSHINSRRYAWQNTERTQYLTMTCPALHLCRSFHVIRDGWLGATMSNIWVCIIHKSHMASIASKDGSATHSTRNLSTGVVSSSSWTRIFSIKSRKK